MNIYFEIALITLAGWRLTSMLSRERGLFGVFTFLRKIVGFKYYKLNQTNGELEEVPLETENTIAKHSTELSKLFSCMWCLSLWVFLFLYLINGYTDLNELILLTLSSSAISIFIEERLIN